MIRVKSTRAVLPDRLDEYSRMAWDKTSPINRTRWIETTRRMVCVYWDNEPLAVLGFRHTSFMGSHVEVWILAYTGLQKHYRQFVRWVKRYIPVTLRAYGRMLIRVEEGYPRGCRLAEVFGFQETSRDIAVDGKVFKRYELWPSLQQ